MIYRSNLTCPDLTLNFKHLHVRPMAHSFGHSVPSDWADKAEDDPMFGLYKRCGLWTHDEAAILYNVALRVDGSWLDIGAHTGWTAAHMCNESTYVTCVDPMLKIEDFSRRWQDNLAFTWDAIAGAYYQTSEEYFGCIALPGGANCIFDGVCIDGDHSEGKPLEDAEHAMKHLTDTGVIIFHDALGRPVREAAMWLMRRGFKARWYSTPHGIILCWRGDFVPPDHVPDPVLVKMQEPHMREMKKDFDFSRCS